MKQNMPFKFRKCHTCPYALGKIKCIVSPCIECIISKRKRHPFSFWESNKHL